MTVNETNLEGCFVVKPKILHDERGYFFESFNKEQFLALTGSEVNFVQDNESMSSKGVLRGLHFQRDEYAQAKLVRVIKGKVLDIAVDIRKKSPTFGQHFSIELSEKNKTQLYIPRGFAHGFLVLEDQTIFSYKCDNYYYKSAEAGIRFNDPTLNIDWKYADEQMVLSEKDKNLPSFETYFK